MIRSLARESLHKPKKISAEERLRMVSIDPYYKIIWISCHVLITFLSLIYTVFRKLSFLCKHYLNFWSAIYEVTNSTYM